MTIHYCSHIQLITMKIRITKDGNCKKKSIITIKEF